MFLFKSDGTISKMNVFNLCVFLIGAVKIFRPLIPAQYIPYMVAGVAVVNLALRTFFTSEPIMK